MMAVTVVTSMAMSLLRADGNRRNNLLTIWQLTTTSAITAPQIFTSL